MARGLIGNVFPSNQYLMERCAPAGFGLGGNGKLVEISSISDIDSLSNNGWYSIHSGNQISVAGFSFSACMLEISSLTENHGWQTIRFPGKTYTVTRFKNDGVWGEWEWDNPPMAVGVEYRTTERWQDKPVYYKVVDFGGLPNEATVAVPIGVENIEWAFLDLSKSWAGPAYDLTTNYLANWANITDMFVNNGQISITTNANMTGTIAYIAAKYTKTTD